MDPTTDATADFEQAGGSGLSQTLGLGGPTNLDAVRNLDAKLYVVRLWYRKMIALDSVANDSHMQFLNWTVVNGAALPIARVATDKENQGIPPITPTDPGDSPATSWESLNPCRDRPVKAPKDVFRRSPILRLILALTIG